MRVKTRKRLRALMLCIATLLGSIGLTVLGPSGPAHADPACVNGGVYVLFARGSGGHFDDKQASAFKASVLSILAGSYGVPTAWAELGNLDGDYQLDELGDYPAVGWADWGILTGMDGYYMSVRTGAAELFLHLIDRTYRCPNESIVLGGYSQGADVIGTALYWLSDYSSVLNHIGYVALYGDPHSTSCNHFIHVPWARGSANCAFGSLGVRIPYVPSSLIGQVGSWCDANDGVCTGNPSRLPILGNPLSSHGTAYDERWISDSALEIANKALSKVIELNPNSSPPGAPNYSITQPTAPDPPNPSYPSSDGTRLALPSGQQYIWQRGVTLPVDYPDAVRYNNEGNSSVQTNWNGPTNSISLPPNTVVRPVGGNQQYLWSSGGQLLPIGDPATSACYMFSFPTSNPTGQPATVPADWASTLPRGNQGQCSLGDQIRFTQSDTGGQQYISIRGAALPVNYDDAVLLDGESDPYRPLTMPAGYVSNPIHSSVPPNTILRAAGSPSQFLWDGSQLRAIQNMPASACLLIAYPQNGVAIVPPSWVAGQVQGPAKQCSLADGTRFTESDTGIQQYVSIRGDAIPLNVGDAQAYDGESNPYSGLTMPAGYASDPIHSFVPVDTVLRAAGAAAQYLWDGSQLHYIPNPLISGCLLNKYPQNGVVAVPASWEATLPVGVNQSCG